MISFLAARAIRAVVVVFSLTLVVFLLLTASGDPAAILASPESTESDIAAIRRDLGLDQPIYVQYWKFLTRAATGDFGVSWRFRRPAMEFVVGRFQATIELAVAAVALAVIVGGVLGLISAAKRGRLLDMLLVSASVTARSIPSFWLGLMLIIVFAVQLGWLPTSGRGTLRHLVLPATTLALEFIAEILLLVRTGVVAVMDHDYIRTARSKGLRERLVYVRHALPNAAIPLVSVLGVIVGRLLGGAVVVETVFGWPGVGLVATQAALARDFPIVMASLFLVATSTVVLNLVVDFAYTLVDPRIRRG